MINLQAEKVRLAKFRERLSKMSDEELVQLGRELRKIPKRVGAKDSFNELAEARAEWKRRHPRA